MDPASRPTSSFSIAKLRRSYAVALSLIAALGIAAAWIFQLHAWNGRDAAVRTNLTGRQRLLTQRVITAAVRVAQHGGMHGSEELAQPHAALTATTSVLNTGFQNLAQAAPHAGLQRMTDSDVAAFERIRPAQRELTSTVDSLVRSHDAAERAMLADAVNASGTRLIALLDSYVHALETRHGAYVQTTKRIAIAFACVLVLLLGLEARFVFQPATNAISHLIADQDAVKAELYAKADEMYQLSVQQEMQNDALQMHQQTLLEQQEELMAQQATLIEQRDHLEERAIELSRLTGILDATPDAVAVFSLTGEVLYANAAAELNLQHVRRRDWTHAAHLLTRDSVRQLRDVGFPRAIRRGLWQGEVSLRNRGGVARSMIQTLIAHRGPDGRVATVSVLHQDITEQKALQVKLAEGEARNRAIVEALAEGVVVQDENGRIIHWNTGAQRILGLSADQLAGRTSVDAEWRAVDARGATLPGERHPISRARLSGESIDGEVMGVHRGDGTLVWLSVNARAMASRGAGGTAAAVATFTDITRSLASARELETLSVVARQTDHGILMVDRTGCITWVNAAWEALSGYTRAEVEGRNPANFLLGTHSRPESIAGIDTAMLSGQRWNGEILHYRPDGTPYWIELDMTPSSDAEGHVTGFIALIRDITTRRTADRERQQLAAAMAVTADGIAITGVSGALEFVNHAFARMHGCKSSDLLQTPWAALYEPDEAQRLVREAIPEVTQVGFWQGEATGRHHDGCTYPQELSLTLLPHGGLVAVARDISDRKASEERLRHLSVRDELTSLYNRRGFLEQADSILKLSARQGVPCALLYGDLDSFKSVNDGFGHDAGDAALKTIADILTRTFRETDLVARLGGDEFTILAIDVRPDDLTIILDRINEAVARSNAERQGSLDTGWHLGISLGVAYFDPDAPEHVETLLRTADEAQYEQKRQRKAQRAQAA